MKVLLVEDDVKIGESIKEGLEQAGHNVNHSLDGESGFQLAVNETFDVGIFDLMLPQKDGFTLLEEIRGKKIVLPVLILSAKNSVPDRVKGLKLGADDYLTKPFAMAELLARLEALYRRSKNTQMTGLSVADLKIDLNSRKAFRAGQEIDLQPREFDLLKYLMENPGRVVSKSTIISQVWNYNFDPQTNIVETRICKLRDKIDRTGLKKLIHTIRGAGYVIRENP